MKRESWWDLFKAGTHTDRKGRTKTFTEADLDYMVETYNPDRHEAPICVDHDENASPVPGGPAYGWLKSLKRDGVKLLGKFHQVVPAFAQAVNEGRFKKRSLGLFADGRVRHVAFLGARIPAVEGLRDNAFTAGDGQDDLEEWDFSLPGLDESEKIAKEESKRMEIGELQKQLAAEVEMRKALEAKNVGLQAENERIAREFSAAEKTRVRQDIDRFITDGINAGTILPAWRDSGMAEFMSGLADESEYEFSAGVKKAPLDWFKEFVTGFAGHPLFKTMTPPENQKTRTGADFSADELAAIDLIVTAGKPAQKGV